MLPIVIIGAGGHAREVADLIRQQNDTLLLGFIDDNPALHGTRRDGIPVLGDWAWFQPAHRTEIRVICAVGAPHITRRLTQRAEQRGLSFATVIAPSALISPHATIAPGAVIFPNVVVNTGAYIGEHCTLNVAVTISHDSRTGRYCNLNPAAHLAGQVTVGDGCYIGMGTHVIQGRAIGAWSIIGAGATVVTDIPANVTAVGVPAKVIKTRVEGWYE